MVGQMKLIIQWKNMFKFYNFLILTILAFPQYLYSADLMDIYNRSLKHNNDLKIIMNEHKISEELYNQTSSTIFPTVSLSANSNKTEINRYVGAGANTDYTAETYSINVTQPIFRLSFFDELEKANDLIKKSNLVVLNEEKIIMIKSAELYFNLINRKNEISAAINKEKMMSLKYDNSKKLFQRGLITDAELNKHRNNYDLSIIEYDMAKNNLNLSEQDIYIFAGKQIEEIHNLDTEIEMPMNNYDVNYIMSKALTFDENIKMAEYDVSISKNDMRSNKSQHYPTLDLVASYDYSDVSSGTRFGANKREGSTVGVSLNIPIYQGGFQTAKVNEARYVYENAQINLDQMKRNLKKTIIEKVNMHNLLKKMIIAKKIDYQSANQNYKSAKKGFTSGTYTDVEVQETKLKLIQTKNSYTKTALDYILMDLQLKKFSSTLTKDNIKEINAMLVW